MMVSALSPAMPEMMAAATSTRIMKSLNYSRNSIHAGFFFLESSWLRPYSSCFWATDAASRPAGEECRADQILSISCECQFIKDSFKGSLILPVGKVVSASHYTVSSDKRAWSASVKSSLSVVCTNLPSLSLRHTCA